MEFRICHSFKNKPQESNEVAQSTKRPPPSDGSDIDHSDPAFFVADIHGTHKLILNKFCVYRPQYILLTQDPTRRQSEPLDDRDIAAAWAVISSLTTPHYVIFNGGKNGGSSRQHKHMQVLETPKPPSLPLDHFLQEGEGSVLPFQTYFTRPPQSVDRKVQGRVLAASYRAHWQACRNLLGILPNDGSQEVAHNVILTEDWLLTIPRRRATTDGIHGHIVNANSMIGHIWLNNEEQLDGWKRRGALNVLGELGMGDT